MINTVLIYDDQDDSLGSFFTLCANKFLQLHYAVYNQSVNSEHKTESCEKIAIETVLSMYNDSKFLFIGFLHGNEEGEAMLVSNEKIISARNAYFFTNAFCYTFSCYCGKNLARKLMENGACVFWGYTDKAYSMVDYEEDFAESAISGLKHFFGGKTVEMAFHSAIQEYTHKIDALYQTDFFAASRLLHNRDAMVVLGDEKLVINDF